MSALFPWAAPTPLSKSRTSPITEGGISLQWQYDKDRTWSSGTGNTIMHSLEKLYHSTMYGRNQLMMQGLHFCLIILWGKDECPPLTLEKEKGTTLVKKDDPWVKVCIIPWVSIFMLCDVWIYLFTKYYFLKSSLLGMYLTETPIGG